LDTESGLVLGLALELLSSASKVEARVGLRAGTLDATIGRRGAGTMGTIGSLEPRASSVVFLDAGKRFDISGEGGE
jgi:hypothetical protein